MTAMYMRTEVVAVRGHSLELDQGGGRDEPTVVETRVLEGQFPNLGGSGELGDPFAKVALSFFG